jgi:hypothetical protein
MEVVVLLLAVVGLALVVIPRMQRRRSGARRPSPVKARKAASKRGRTARNGAAAPVVAPPTVATWGSSPSVSPDVEAWDDDLGWEGVDSTPPEARDAWEQWRATESPLASSPEPEPAAEPELPSIERWRAKAEEPEWEEDDDGLGWEGEEKPSNANAFNGGHDPAPESGSWHGDGRRDWSRATEAPPARETDPAPAFVTAASAATDVAPAPEPELGRTIALEDDDWDPPVTKTWGARESAPAAASAKAAGPARRKPRTSRMHPVLLVAIYAAVGIGFVVLASTALLGGSPDPAPASKKTPAAAKTPSSTPPAAAPKAGATPDAAAEEAAAAAARAERAARVNFGRERSRALRSEAAALSNARAAARREARAAKRKRERARPSAPLTNSSPPAPPASTPPPTYVPPSQPAPRAPTPKRRSVCEFCIG